MRVCSPAQSPGGLFEVTVLTGREVWRPLYKRLSDGQVFVAGEPGETFRLRVDCLEIDSIEVIIAVDGKNILKNEPGDVQKNQGTVVQDSCIFHNQRLSDKTERLTFSELDGVSSGVIGFAAYRASERQAPGTASSARKLDGFLLGALPTTNADTGSDISRHINATPFERTGGPDILVIRYGPEAWLREQGIMPEREPAAFPGID